jgi:cysteine desulfurase
VLDAMLPFLREEFGNASSATHAYGWRAETAAEDARESLARALGARSSREIVFTSGATESDNLALQGVARAYSERGDHLVTCAIEHPAVLETAAALEREGRRVTLLPVDGEGRVDPDAVRRAIEPRTVLVSIAAANGEIGVLQPLDAIGAVCREREVLFHSDAAQAAGKLPLDVERTPIDLLSLSGHKMYGPKGVGALYVRGRAPRVRLAPLLHGGGQQEGRRPGTVPLALWVGLAHALELCLGSLEAEAARLRALRERLLAGLRRELDDVVVNGPPEGRLPGNLNLSFPGAPSDALLAALPDVALSSGSACASGRPGPSPVLVALGLSPERQRTAVRIGLGRFNTEAEIDTAAARLVQEVRKLREQAPALR